MKTKGTLFFRSDFRFALQTNPAARERSVVFSLRNSTIIQVKAACDGDNMRIVGELNTSTCTWFIESASKKETAGSVYVCATPRLPMKLSPKTFQTLLILEITSTPSSGSSSSGSSATFLCFIAIL